MKLYEPKLVILDTAEAVAEYVANQVIAQIHQKPNLVLTVPTGNTPIPIYQRLVESYQKGQVSFAQVRLCNLDEYWPLPANHPDSYAAYMHRHLLDHVDVNLANWHIPRSDAPDPVVESLRYDQLVSQLQVDHALVGLGPALTNHLGFNEAGSSFESRTRLVEIAPETQLVNKALFADENQFVSTAITQGLGTIMESGQVTLVATGTHKAQGVQKFLVGPVSEASPASVLRTRENVEVVLDKDAAELVESRS